MTVKHRSPVASLSAILAAVGGLIGISKADPIAPPPTTPSAADALQVAMDFSTAFEKVAAEVSPAVVNITATLQMARQLDPMEDMYRRFFGGGGGGRQQMQTQQGFGSGVIVSADGYILTNNHVVANAQKLDVRLSNDQVYPAKVIGTDPQTDVAVIKIDAPPSAFTPAKVGDSSKAKPGQWVLAIGSPFNLTQSVTSGIVSAVGRSTRNNGMGGGLTAYDNFIQTDAAINPGNSGGPLVNLKGEVIGINTAIFSRSGGSVGIGFAIPINLARTIMNSIIETGSVEQGGWLGVSMPTLEQFEQMRVSGQAGEGVPVDAVTEDAPAAAAGIMPKDVITAVDGLPTRDPLSLRTIVNRIPAGKSVPVQILRDGKLKTVNVTVQAIPEKIKRERLEARANSVENELGIAVRTLAQHRARALGLDEGAVEVTEMSPKSGLIQMGVGPGTIIVALDGVPMTDEQAFTQQVMKMNLKQGVTLSVLTRRGVTDLKLVAR